MADKTIKGDVGLTPEAQSGIESGIESGITSELLEQTITIEGGDLYYELFGGRISKPFKEFDENDSTINNIQKRINHLLNLPQDIHKEDSDYNIQNLRNRLELLELSRGKPNYPNNGDTYYYNNFNSTILNGPKANQYAAAFINTVRESGKRDAASSRNVSITIKFKGETDTVKKNQVSIVKGAFLDGGRPPNLVKISQQGEQKGEYPLLSVEKKGEGKDVIYTIGDVSEQTKADKHISQNVRPMYFASVMSLQLQSRLSCTPSQAQSIVKNYASLFSTDLLSKNENYNVDKNGKRTLNDTGEQKFKQSLKDTLFCDDKKAEEILHEFKEGPVANLVNQLQSHTKEEGRLNKRFINPLGHLGNAFKNDKSIQKTPTTYVVFKNQDGKLERVPQEKHMPRPPTLARGGETENDTHLREIKQNQIAANVGKLDYVTIQKYELLVDFSPERLENLDVSTQGESLKSFIDTNYNVMCQPSKSSGQEDDLALATSPSDAAKPPSPKSGPGASLEGTSPQKNDFDKMVAEINKTNNLLTPIEDRAAYIKRIEANSEAITGTDALTLGKQEPGK
ncbi:MAG: hypothetical protein CMF42_01870 [Legionellales bacterium]|nr:hypothetical protein [Legionellales bacterium]